MKQALHTEACRHWRNEAERSVLTRRLPVSVVEAFEAQLGAVQLRQSNQQARHSALKKREPRKVKLAARHCPLKRNIKCTQNLDVCLAS